MQVLQLLSRLAHPPFCPAPARPKTSAPARLPRFLTPSPASVAFPAASSLCSSQLVAIPAALAATAVP